MKNGWALLIYSLVCGFLGFYIFTASLNIYFGSMAAVVGFISPSIVYFGNRI
jgi:hypothetical protein